MDTQAGASPRLVGSLLHFSNPFVQPGATTQFPAGGNVAVDPSGYDLGDATFGSALVRFVSALDGVTPYKFTSTTAGTMGLTLGATGRVTGVFTGAVAAPLNFQAQVLDAAGVSRTGLFFLTPVSSAILHFAQNNIPQASVGQDYNTNLEVIGGDTTNTIFGVVSGSVLINGIAASGLEVEGLTLFPDGTLSGRPLLSGTVTFRAQAIRNGAHALNRALTGPDQAYSLQVLAINSIQSVLATSRLTVQTGRPGRDSLTFSAFVNANGQNTSSFGNKTMTVHFGTQSFSTNLDSFGQSRNRNFSVKFSAFRGTLSVSIRNADLSSTLGANVFDRIPTTAILQVSIGDGFLGTEALGLSIRSRHGSVRGSYQLGHTVQLGGLFQIIGVSAGDFGGNTAFKIKFLLSHVRGNSGLTFGVGTQATVNIGPSFSENVQLFRNRGHFSSPGIRTISLNLNSKLGAITTYALPASQTGVQSATQGKVQTLLLGLDLKTTTLEFFGEGSSQLVPFTGFR